MQSTNTVNWPTPPERTGSTHLPSGRTLAWSEWGPATGQPVLFCPGAAMSGTLAIPPIPSVRLIAIDRPGLGRSTPDPAKTLDSWAADIAALGLRRPRAIGFSQGAPFALALAHAGIVESAAIVSGQDDLTHPTTAAQLHPDVTHFVESINADPAAFTSWFEEMSTPAGMLDRIVTLSGDRDRAVYTDPRFAPLLRQAVEEGFAQGPRGYVLDLINAMSPWPFRVEDIEAPVYLWYGALDTSTVHSPDFGATLAARLPRATRILDPEEGGSILWTRAARIQEKLLS